MADIAAAVIGGAQLLYNVYQGEETASAQREGRRRTQRTNAVAQSNAQRQERENQRETARAQANSPDIRNLLAGEAQPAGGLGIPTSQLLLGNRKLGL